MNVSGPRIDRDHSLDAGGARRLLLVIPALVQLGVGGLLILEARKSLGAPAINYTLAFLHLVGAVGILSRRTRLFYLGLASSALGLALPALINALATPVDKDYSILPGVGLYDAEGTGFLMLLRVIFETPFWLLYGVTVAVRWARRGRANS